MSQVGDVLWSIPRVTPTMLGGQFQCARGSVGESCEGPRAALSPIRPTPSWPPPWVMDLISMVLGIRSSEGAGGCTDLRLILDLKRVLMRVDLPRPLCPREGMS